MDEETERNETWDVVPKPKEEYSVSCKWVYKIFYLKKKTNLSAGRFKARANRQWFFLKVWRRL